MMFYKSLLSVGALLSLGTTVIAAATPSNTTTSTTVTSSNSTSNGSVTLDSTILVLVRDETAGKMITSGIRAYGMPYEIKVIPSEGADLPALNASSSQGNYGSILVLGELAFEYPTGWSSSLKKEQWQQLYDYQTGFNVRMVRLDAYPGPDFGTTAVGGCCGSYSVEHDWYWTDTSSFPTAGLKSGPDASIKTSGLWHYSAQVADTATTREIAAFKPSSDGSFPDKTTAAVINTFDKREQMVFFISWATEWSPTSTYLQHAWIQWMTRGMFAGMRRVHFSTQVDDMLLSTNVYRPINGSYRSVPDDLEAHLTWQANIQTRMPAGSKYFMELAHNGVGPVWYAVMNKMSNCNPNKWVEAEIEIPATTLEYQKPLGTGEDFWPDEFTNYTWSKACVLNDPLTKWFAENSKRGDFGHLSHTYTHLYFNNATYSDTVKEMSFNNAFFKQIGLDTLPSFSKGLVPPAITGMHNGDVIRAWMESGIKYAVGDNTRPVLMNQDNVHWPLISTMANNGHDGLVIVPRFSTSIYYNCATSDCTTEEWINTSGGKGTFDDLLKQARDVNSRYLFGLRQDPYMFHQANMRVHDVDSRTVGVQTGKMSILMAWTETVVQEFTRLVEWPLLTLKHDDIGKEFVNRMTRDKCNYKLTYKLSADKSAIEGATLTADGNKCDAPVPVTFNGEATTTATGTKNEKVGKDPLTIWANMTGQAVEFKLTTPLKL